MSTDNPKKSLFAQFALVAKALSHGNRLELLEFLAQGERNVESLARLTDISVANASQHLQRLQRAGLVIARRDGHSVCYRLADEKVVTLLGALRVVTENNVAEVDRIIAGYFTSKDSFEPISHDQLLNRSREGLVTVLDVRPKEEFDAGHLPDAINIPLKELEHRLNELPKDQEIVAYCRGSYCVLAFEAVEKLRNHGFDVRRLEEGLPEWKLAGLPVECERKNI